MARKQAAGEELAGRDGETEAKRDERDEREASKRVEQDLDELTETKRERDEYLELAQRTKADFENYRKRVAKEAEAATARGKAELAGELIPVLDNLERALTAVSPAGEGGTEAGDRPQARLDALVKGVTLVLDELRSTLGRAGVEAYDPAGEAFDPSWHEAISTTSGEGAKPGTVMEVLDKGYRLDGQVLRPARVVVSE